MRRLLASLIVLGTLAPPASGSGEPETQRLPTSALLQQGCVDDDGPPVGRLLPGLVPCGVHVAPDGSAAPAAVPPAIGSPGSASAGPGWERLRRPSPERRVNVALATFPPLDGVVMFGGLVCPGVVCNPVSETWLWQGERWRRLEPATSPPPLHAAAMTYDPARKELLLFGGETCTPTECSFSSATWTFDGATWRQRETTVSPPASAASAIAYDEERRRVIVTGGCAQRRCPGLVGTWSWDGAGWTLEDLLTPLVRHGASAATNPGGGIVLFGGQDVRSATIGETWIWDGEWRQVSPPTSPPSRMYGGATSDGARAIFFAGSNVTCNGLGCTGSYLSDMWAWNGTTWSQLQQGTAPRGGQSLAIAHDAARGEIVRFGGISNFSNYMGASTTAYESSTWIWEGDGWRERRSPMPEERIQGALGYHPGTDRLILAGGNCVYTTTCDTWAWDGERWERIGDPAPRPNSRTSLIPHAPSGAALFPTADGVWALTHDDEEERWSWVKHEDSAAPVPGGSVTALDRQDSVVLFGSQSCSGSGCTYLDQTWRWAGIHWEQVPAAPRPPGRAFAAMAFQPQSGNTILFGGLSSGGQVYHDDTWAWNGSTWRQIAAAGPRNRAFTRIADDPATGDVLLVGGISGPPEYQVLGDHWMFDGAAWRQVPGGPGTRTEHALGGHPGTRQTLLFGGQDANPGRPMSDTWIWSGE